MIEESAPASAIGSPVLARIRGQVPEFELAFQMELEAEGLEMGAFQAMSVFADWLAKRLENSPEGTDVQRAFHVVEEIASTDDFPMGRSLVTEFVEALRDNPRAVRLMGPDTRRVV